MKKIFLTFFLALVLIQGCDSQKDEDKNKDISPSTEVQEVELNEEFTLSPGQEAVIEETGLSIYFLDVESDSRCPSDVICVHPGEVLVDLNIIKDGKLLKEYPYIMSKGNTEYLDEYNLQLLNIKPERGKQFQEIEKVDYKAIFKLELKYSERIQNIEVQEPTGVIFTKESAPYTEQFTKAQIENMWTPSIEEVKAADKIVEKCLQDPAQIIDQKVGNLYRLGYVAEEPPINGAQEEKDFYKRVLDKIEPVYENYFRQYVGYKGESGEKTIWINFFLPQKAEEYQQYYAINWKKELITPPDTEVRSDYHGFFEVQVDLEKEQCLNWKLGT